MSQYVEVVVPAAETTKHTGQAYYQTGPSDFWQSSGQSARVQRMCGWAFSIKNRAAMYHCRLFLILWSKNKIHEASRGPASMDGMK